MNLSEKLSALEEKVDSDTKIFCYITLQKIASNVVVNPNAIFSKTVPKNDEVFFGTLKDCPYTDVILQELGFQEGENAYLLPYPNPSVASKIENELKNMIENELVHTKIYTSLSDVKSKNEIRDAVRVSKLLDKSFQNVLRDPHATKYHRLLLRKLLGKQLKGGLSLLASLELSVNNENETVEFVYPFPRGVTRIERIFAVLEMSIQKLCLSSDD